MSACRTFSGRGASDFCSLREALL
ncbi:hypothetical protein CP09DC79_1098A, partial [Chlamydia psittaci 09DC79]